MPGDEINSGDSVGNIKATILGTKVYTISDKHRVESAEWTTIKDVSIGDTQRSPSGWWILLLILNMNIDSAATAQSSKY